MLKQLIQSRVNRMANLRKELRKLTKKSKPKKYSFESSYDFVYYDEVLTDRLSYDKATSNVIPEDLID